MTYWRGLEANALTSSIHAIGATGDQQQSQSGLNSRRRRRTRHSVVYICSILWVLSLELELASETAGHVIQKEKKRRPTELITISMSEQEEEWLLLCLSLFFTAAAATASNTLVGLLVVVVVVVVGSCTTRRRRRRRTRNVYLTKKGRECSDVALLGHVTSRSQQVVSLLLLLLCIMEPFFLFSIFFFSHCLLACSVSLSLSLGVVLCCVRSERPRSS